MIKGDEFNISFHLSSNIYEGFINIFKDKNILHINDQYAIGKNFKSKVMHGNILNGFISYFIGEKLPLKNVIIHSQSIEFKSPVYLGDNLKFYAIIDEVYDSVQAIVFKYHFMNEANVKVAKGKIQIGII